MKIRKANEEDKRNLINYFPKDRNKQLRILDCIEGLTEEDIKSLLGNAEFLPHFALKDYAESVYYVGDDAEAFIHEAIRRFLAKRKLPEDISRVDISSLLSFLFSKDHNTSFTEYRDIILQFSYKTFSKSLQVRKEYLNKLLEEYNYVYKQNSDLVQKEKHYYQQLYICSNMKNLKKWKTKVKESLDENKLRSHVSWKLSRYNSHQFDLFNNDPIFAPSGMYSPKIIEQRFRWMQHIPAGDYREFTQTNDKSILARSIPNFMSGLKEYLNSYEPILDIEIHTEAILEAINSYEAGFKRAAITLLLRENEGLVWDLARQISDKHNISFNKINKQLKMEHYTKTKEITSLPMLLAIRDWPPIFKGQHGKLTLGERLGYLSIDYSHERNLIVHGTSTEFDTDWKWFELISACLDILETFEELQGRNQEEEFEDFF
ncbi:hypothetical protein [Paenibacillus sp. FJAT-27812]|uniref:hypothetical protein n=1 Tax=Paenibacillus sp. FJAT-27812 TaxID=1684143 RepID=UPI0006A77B31|nr:hypothetical protein [Paenibacillus sp. FJAT-27812]